MDPLTPFVASPYNAISANAPYAHIPRNDAKQTQPKSKKASQKQKKAAQNSRSNNQAFAQNTEASNFSAQDFRPNKKARTHAVGYEGHPPFVQESLNQSMQRLGSNKAAKNRHGSKAAKANSGMNYNSLSVPIVGGPVNHITPPAIQVTSDLQIAHDPAKKREKAKHFLTAMHDNHVGFEDLVGEGIDTTTLKALYAEIGINPTVRDSAPAKPPGDFEDLDEDIYEPTDEPNAMLGLNTHNRLGPLAVETPGATKVHDSQHDIPASATREDYLARLKALKSGNSIPPVHSGRTPRPISDGLSPVVQTPHAVASLDPSVQSQAEQDAVSLSTSASQDDIARARDRARRAFLASRAARKAQEPIGSTSAPAVQSPIGFPVDILKPSVDALNQHETAEYRIVDREEEQGVTLEPIVGVSSPAQASPTTSALPEGARLPGLFMSTASPSAHQQPPNAERSDNREDSEPNNGVLSPPEEGEMSSPPHEENPSPRPGVEPVLVSPQSDMPGTFDQGAFNNEDFIKFGEADDYSFPGYQRSAEPDIPGLTAISRHRPQSTASNRPPLKHTPSYQDHLQGHMSKIDEMKRRIELAELKKRVKARRTATLSTPQAESHLLEGLASAMTSGQPGTDQLSQEQIPPYDGASETALQTTGVIQPEHAAPFVPTDPALTQSHRSLRHDSEATSRALRQTGHAPSMNSGASPVVPPSKENVALDDPVPISTQRSSGGDHQRPESRMARMEALKAEMQRLQEEMQREQEVKDVYTRDPELLGVDTANIPDLQLQETQDKTIASVHETQRTPSSASRRSSRTKAPVEAVQGYELEVANNSETTVNQEGQLDVLAEGDEGVNSEDQFQHSRHVSKAQESVASSMPFSNSAEGDEAMDEQMEIDSSSEGEIQEGKDSYDDLFEDFDDSQPQSPFAPALDISEIPQSHVEPTTNDFEQLAQHQDSDTSTGQSSIAMDLEGSDRSEQCVSQANDDDSDVAEYSPEPSIPFNEMLPVDATRAVSIPSSSSTEASEEYEPPQPDDHPVPQEPISAEADEDDYEPPGADDGSLDEAQLQTQYAPNTGPVQQVPELLPEELSDPDDLFGEGSSRQSIPTANGEHSDQETDSVPNLSPEEP